MDEVIFLVGPTAVGKTDASTYLARLINAEIISCDSMQVYKGMDIGTQKPKASQRKKIPHHLIDVISPSRNFSVAEFRKRALVCIKKIRNKGKIPLFVGGTALYMKALIDGLFPAPPADTRLRKRLLAQEEKNGRGFLYKKLLKIDLQAAKTLHPNDTRRIIRALEVYIKTRKTVSELKKQTKGLMGSYDVKIFALNLKRQELYNRIDRRVDKMFREGLIDECRRLKKKRVSMTASKALGYKEVFDYLGSKISLAEAKETIKKNTRHFAKRQLSWFRNDKRLVWVDVDARHPKDIAEEIGRLCMR
jgi:tRNA dimethylallyltransferase